MLIFNQITIILILLSLLLYPNNSIHHHGIHENNNDGIWNNPILSSGIEFVITS